MLKLLIPLFLSACVGVKSESGDDLTASWYTTCGDPSCHGYDGAIDGVPLCASEVEGATCFDTGATCDLQTDCNERLICATEDPKDQEGGCPISRARYKTGIRYLSAGERDAMAAELLSTRLARYRYKGASPETKERLGFIIDDQPASVSVAPDGDHVDVYAFTSQAVAAIQVQQEQITALKAQVEALSAEVAVLKAR